MESIELIRRNLERSEELVLARIDDMRQHCTVAPTPNGGCHTLWILGHLAYIEALVVRRFMLGGTNPLEEWGEVFDGAEVSGEPSRFPGFDEVLQKCREVRAATRTLLDSHAESELDERSRAAPPGFEDLLGTRRACFQYVADHWYMHRGQLADARRAAGKSRMWL